MNRLELTKELGTIASRYKNDDPNDEIISLIPILYGFRIGIGDMTGFRDLW